MLEINLLKNGNKISGHLGDVKKGTCEFPINRNISLSLSQRKQDSFK